MARRDSVGYVAAEVPADLFPAETLYLRLRCRERTTALFQVDRVDFSGPLTDPSPDADGQTHYVTVGNTTRDLVVEQLAFSDSQGPERPVIRVTVRNRGTAAVAARFATQVTEPQPGTTAEKRAADEPASR